MRGAANQPPARSAAASPADVADVRHGVVRMPECADERAKLVALFGSLRAQPSRLEMVPPVFACACGGRG